MSEQRTLDGETLLTYLQEVARELPDDGTRRRLVVVGGALLAWLGLRDATRDIDSASPIDEVLQAAVETVATRHDLAPQWINDSAAPFVPHGFDPARGELIWADDRLEVIGAPVDQAFLMKVHAARASDLPDIRSLWPRSKFATPAQAAAAYSTAYPLEPHDPHLADWFEHRHPTGLVKSRMRWKSHVRSGGRPGKRSGRKADTTPWSDPYLRALLAEYLARYDQHRPHRGLGQRASDDHSHVVSIGPGHPIRRHTTCGGLINEYRTAA